jgi:hypothetical protein
MIRPVRVLVLILVICNLAAVPALSGENTVPTTGEFLQQIALARHLPAVDGHDAARLLGESGIQLPALTLSLPLTEGQVAAISRSLGVVVTTSSPDGPFESSSVAAFLDLLAAQAPKQSTTSGESGPYPRPNDRAADPRTKGRGKKKGLPPVSESSPI